MYRLPSTKLSENGVQGSSDDPYGSRLEHDSSQQIALKTEIKVLKFENTNYKGNKLKIQEILFVVSYTSLVAFVK